jgi:hypothetical protein
MFSKGTTWPPTAPTRKHAPSGSIAPTSADRLENGRSSSEPAAVTPSDSRQTESHWESVIDRATD